MILGWGGVMGVGEVEGAAGTEGGRGSPTVPGVAPAPCPWAGMSPVPTPEMALANPVCCRPCRLHSAAFSWVFGA